MTTTTTTTPARKPRRILVRGSRFRVGQLVTVEGDFCGDYHGIVVATHVRLVKPRGVAGEQHTAPGVTVEVRRWESDLDLPVSHRFQIVAHDDETTRR